MEQNDFLEHKKVLAFQELRNHRLEVTSFLASFFFFAYFKVGSIYESHAWV